jgi:hypothetical protein
MSLFGGGQISSVDVFVVIVKVVCRVASTLPASFVIKTLPPFPKSRFTQLKKS